MSMPDNSNERGRRAEEVAQWYFRLNGFLQTGFVLHDDNPHCQITEADILAARFPHAEESLRKIRMTDDLWIRKLMPNRQTLVVIAEVTQGSGPIKVNAPWLDAASGAMPRAIARLGFIEPARTATVAKGMYERLRWSGDGFVLQFVSIGDRPNRDLSKRFQDLIQLSWDDIAGFFWDRFHAFGAIKGWPPQWPQFGRSFAHCVESGAVSSAAQAMEFVVKYIQVGQ